MKKFLLTLALGLMVVSCSDKEEVYPSIITEFVSAQTDGNGVMDSIQTDPGDKYRLVNPYGELKPNTRYRLLAGFVVTPEGRADLYTLAGVHVLHDSTLVAQHDAVEVQSSWSRGKYFNLILLPKTQGGISNHYWGYVVDSLNATDSYISIHHCQNADPTSYTTTIYASIPLDSIAPEGQTVHLNH